MASDLDRRVEELASRQHNVFGVAQLLLLGVTRSAMRHRLRTGRWIAERRRVLRVVGAPVTYRSRLMAVVLGARCPVVVSHRAAAALYGISGFGEGLLEVTALPGGFAQLPDVVQHRTTLLPEHHLTTIDGIPATAPARMLCDLTAVTGALRAERATDEALASGLVSPTALGRCLEDLAGPGRRKTRAFRAIVDARRAGYVPPASALEARFLELVEEHDLPWPEQQVDLADLDGWIGRVDFLFRDAGLVVETDGRRHHSTVADQAVDRARDDRIEALGMRVRRLTWTDVVLRPHATAAELAFLLTNPGIPVAPRR